MAHLTSNLGWNKPSKKKERFKVCCIFLRLSTFKVSYSSLPSFHPGACACRQVGWRSFCGTLSVVCVLSCTRHGHLQSKEKKYAHFPYMHHLFFLLILRISTSFENKVDSLYVKDNNNNDSVGKKQGSHLLWREKKTKQKFVWIMRERHVSDVEGESALITLEIPLHYLFFF